jgi:hypothetical protein
MSNDARVGLKGRTGLCMAASIAWAAVSGKRTVRPLCLPQSIMSASRAASKHPFGACTSPTPIIPIPGSQCAMPVSSQGVIPARITLRTSIPAGVPRKLSGGIVSAGQHFQI